MGEKIYQLGEYRYPIGYRLETRKVPLNPEKAAAIWKRVEFTVKGVSYVAVINMQTYEQIHKAIHGFTISKDITEIITSMMPEPLEYSDMLQVEFEEMVARVIKGYWRLHDIYVHGDVNAYRINNGIKRMGNA